MRNKNELLQESKGQKVKMRLKPINIIFFVLICIFSLAAPAAVKVRAYAEPTAVAPEDILTLNVEVEYDSERNIEIPRLPRINHFLLIDSHQGHHVQIINGVVSKKKQYRYILRSVQEGKFQIDSISVIVDGKTYKTQPVNIEVSDKIASAPAPFSQGQGGSSLRKFFPHFFPDVKDVFPSPKQRIQKKDVKFRLDLEKKEVYVGEMILAEWFFYLPDDNTFNVDTEVLKNVDLDGFWVESVVQLGSAGAVPPQFGNIGNKKYIKKLLMASALFPVRAGVLNVGPMRVKSRFISGAIPFFGRPTAFEKESNKESIKVLPLPEEGKGKFFTEAVGDFTVSANINKTVISVQEPLIYKISFKGEGHPRLIRLPNLNFGDSFEKYDTTESQKFTVSDSFKDFEIILIPKTNGILTTPSFELSTFDAELGIYKTHILPSFKVNVAGVMVPDRQKGKSERYFDPDTKASDKVQKQDKTVKEDILIPLIEDQEEHFLIKNRKNFWFVIFSSLFLFFILVLKRNFFIRKNKNPLKVQIKKDLIKVDKAIKNEQWKEAGIEMNQLMHSFFSELSEKDKVVKNWDTLLQHIHPSIRIKYEEQIRNLVSRVERLSFASSSEAEGFRNKRNVEQLKKDLVVLIQKISNEYF